MNAENMYRLWKKNFQRYENIQNELRKLDGNEGQIEERFGRELKFGTAGIRGKMGVRTNCMNEITVGRTT